MARIDQHLAAGADLGPQREVAPLRGSDLLPQVVARAHGSTTEAMTRACTDLAPSLFWKQNPNYSDKAMQRAGYMDAYGYAELIGPTGWSLRRR